MIPANAPLPAIARTVLDAVLAQLDAVQKAWLVQYLQGTTTTAAKALILYGTESGNSEKLADLSAKEAKKRGIQATVKNMADITPADLAKHQNLLLIISTWGDGEPPDTATTFYNALMSRTEAYPSLAYSVCALGDTSYEKFCQTGKDIDTKLESLGAKRLIPRQDCDVDFEEAHKDWLAAALAAIQPAATLTAAPVADVSSTKDYSLKNPCIAEVTENILLNGKGTAKETIHLEISLAGTGLTYTVGDSLAVIPVNHPDVVQDLIHVAGLTGEEEVEIKAIGKKSLRQALTDDLDITGLSRAVLNKLNTIRKDPALEHLLAEENKEALKEYTWGREIVDAIADFAPTGIAAQDLVNTMRKLPPRLYSISSSPLAHEEEVHLTVAAVRYTTQGRKRKGVASTYIAEVLTPGTKVKIYPHANKNFRLPENPQTPIIMVGPGTGIAPFRAFIEHRAALGHPGKNWLFFGDQHYMFDFLYQTEWQEHLANGTLTKLDVAFSRDQPEKIYVQDRMREKSRELYDWLQQGAYFYVCGDASRMAHDVHEALIALYQTHASLTREAAESELETLKKAKRYQRDVY